MSKKSSTSKPTKYKLPKNLNLLDHYLCKDVQQIIINYVACEIDANLYYAYLSGKNIYLTGAAGTGKSYNIKNLIEWLRLTNNNTICSNNKSANLNTYEDTCNIVVTASTGKAAINIGGTTIHRWSGLFDMNGDLKSRVKWFKEQMSIINDPFAYGDVNQTFENYLLKWQQAQVLIIDEVSMIGASYLDYLDKIGRILLCNMFKPFGGIQVIFVGDALQLPPVNDKWFFQSNYWKSDKPYKVNLIIPKRFTDYTFYTLLKNVRMGKITLAEREMLNRVRQTGKVRVSKLDGVILAPTNRFVDNINEKRLSKLRTMAKTYNHISFSTCVRENTYYTSPKLDVILNNNTTFTKSDVFYDRLFKNNVEEKLTLKIGAKVMVNSNLSYSLVDITDCQPNVIPPLFIANGMTGLVERMMDDGVVVKFETGFSLIIKHYKYVIDDNDRDGVLHVRAQLPLQLAWACSIHKSQGATIDKVYLYMDENKWNEKGMAYVALSRCRNLESLVILSTGKLPIKANKDAVRFENGK